MAMLLVLPLLLASAAPPVRPAAPPPAAARTVPVEPAATDEEVWALARKVGTAPAYETYLERFPQGAHHDEAVQAYYGVQGRPVIYAPPPLSPPHAPPSAFTTTPCASLLVDQSLKKVDSEDARAYLAARSINRPADFQAYLAKFPGGACRPEAAAAIWMRSERRLRFKPIPGFGPLAARRMTRRVIIEDDYPASALRNEEQGRVEAEWDVAEDGVPEACRIVRSSGSAALDEATCRAVIRRLLYDPARDAAGNPVRSTDHMGVTWSLPAEAPPQPPTGAPG